MAHKPLFVRWPKFTSSWSYRRMTVFLDDHSELLLQAGIGVIMALILFMAVAARIIGTLPLR